VKVYLDTNVLVAASVQDHEHHVQSFELVKAVKLGALRACVSTHGLAEYYSVITRAPFVPRIHPSEAGRFLEENILPYFELVALSTGDYKTVFRGCAGSGVIGARVFDALHIHCAQKANCDRIYTYNVKDFRAVAPTGFAEKIAAP
jgi:predicted nucleic acid-binding protein